MTERLYFTDCYIKEFKATINEIYPNGIVLNKSAFYPEGGGQLGDRGKIYYGKDYKSVLKVKNTRQKQDKVIHELESTKGLETGMLVEGQLDWEQRYQQMRAHSAQHIISRYFQLKLKAETVSNQLKRASGRLDFSPLTKLTPKKLDAISEEINGKISKDMKITFVFLQREEAIAFLKEKEYQVHYLEMVPKSVKEFRIVSIDDYDWAACAGTHVRNSQEIGGIKIEKTENKGKLRERIYYSLVP